MSYVMTSMMDRSPIQMPSAESQSLRYNHVITFLLVHKLKWTTTLNLIMSSSQNAEDAEDVSVPILSSNFIKFKF